MNLELRNVGKIKYANVELNGITVLAGENNTGKSTIGKMLFCIFHSFCKIEEQIREERIKSMERVLSSFDYGNPFIRFLDITLLAKKIINSKELFLTNRSDLIKELEQFYTSNEEKVQQSISQEELEKLAERVCVFLKLEDSEIRKTILRKRLQAEFAMNVGNLNHLEDDGKTTVKLTIKNNTIDFVIIKNKEIHISNYISLTKEIIYIDDPFILDDLDVINVFTTFTTFEHRGDLLNKIVNGKAKDPFDFTIIDEIIAEKKLEKILKIMNDVCSGSLQAEEGKDFVYKEENFNGTLNMVNLSTGIKSFVILKQLLQNGIIDEHGVIILDEPEIHLHPEWQLKFAESIVLIQKEFHTNILLNTHSPYFLNAIEVYSQKYGVDDKCKYYLAEDRGGNAVISDVTDKTEVLYAKLAQPLQKLENLEYGNGNTI